MVGFLSGFCSWLLSGAGSIAAVAIALPTALKAFYDLSDFTIKLIAIALIIGLTIYNYFGVKNSSILQNVSMIAKLIPIGLIMFGALIMGKQTPNLSLTPVTGGPVTFTSILGMIAFATVATLWAYEGWTNLNTVAEEIKNPKKNLPLAIIIAIGSILALYTVFNYSIYKVLPYEDIVTMIDNKNYYLGTEVAKRLFGNVGGTIVLTGMLISIFGCLNGMILTFPRTYYAMSVEGHFFKALGKLHPKYKIPHVALIIQCIIASCLVLSRNLDQLTSMVVFVSMFFNVLVVVAVLIYRKRYPKLEKPYKVWGYPITVILTILIFVGLMINTFIEDPVTALITGTELYVAISFIKEISQCLTIRQSTQLLRYPTTSFISSFLSNASLGNKIDCPPSILIPFSNVTLVRILELGKNNTMVFPFKQFSYFPC